MFSYGRQFHKCITDKSTEEYIKVNIMDPDSSDLSSDADETFATRKIAAATSTAVLLPL